MKSFGLIGAGNFGKSLKHQLSCMKRRVYVYDKNKTVLPDILVYSDVVIIAVKPDKAKEVCKDIIDNVGVNRPLFVSAMAGVPLDFLRLNLETDKVIRIMCDLNYSTCPRDRDIFVYTETKNKDLRLEYTKILSDLGVVTYVESDEAINKVTALIGCGPAFVASYLKDYIKIFDESLDGMRGETYVSRLFKRTINDIHLYSELPDNIISRVACKGGATEEALSSLNSIEGCIREAVCKAEMRCKSLN